MGFLMCHILLLFDSGFTSVYIQLTNMIVTRMNMKKNVSIFGAIIINKQNSRNDETFRDTNKKGEAEREKKNFGVFFFF